MDSLFTQLKGIATTKVLLQNRTCSQIISRHSNAPTHCRNHRQLNPLIEALAGGFYGEQNPSQTDLHNSIHHRHGGIAARR
jgi:hypothetical protein